MPESISRHYRIAAGHPCLTGHFPDNPIVPGVILLDYTQCLLNYWKPAFRITGVPQAKFHQPLYPEQNFSIQLTGKTALSIKFECFTAEFKLASGMLTIEKTR